MRTSTPISICYNPNNVTYSITITATCPSGWVIGGGVEYASEPGLEREG